MNHAIYLITGLGIVIVMAIVMVAFICFVLATLAWLDELKLPEIVMIIASKLWIALKLAFAAFILLGLAYSLGRDYYEPDPAPTARPAR